jgi:methionyl-tRNA synthetase
MFWGDKSHPRAIHLVGKDILRFHAVYWPCFLMSVGLPLPKRIFAHGWWTIEGQKMSKSLGNAIDPIKFTQEYGVDAFRLFLFREFPIGQDGDFSLKNFKERVNADLANNLGNLVSRTLNLIQKNLDGDIFKKGFSKPDVDYENLIKSPFETVRNLYLDENAKHMEKFNFNPILQGVFQLLNGVNKYLEVKAPWAMAKDMTRKEEMIDVLNISAEVIRLSAIMLWPFIPSTSEEILKRLGQKEISLVDLKKDLAWGQGAQSKVTVGTPLFMRLT